MRAFECKTCGACCYGEGGIYLSREDVEGIARFLKMPPETFLAECCEERNRRLYIRTGPDGFCLFYDPEEKCRIHPVKPEPCRLWPFFPAIVGDRDNWQLAMEACPGINPECSFEEFVRQAGEAQRQEG
ncbi:MAG: YkgJ family cysteine cluster protein [Deltaproteobacteria bacterium]|nr:YkgJ family cysteine cluster protein [Deltaproteobacteria bacterium]